MKTEQNNISKALLPEPTLRRLPWYLAYVSQLRHNGVEHVSSTQIAKEICVDASQIAKDLSFINIKGKTRIGYEVKQLEKQLTDFLGFKQTHKAFMIGAGSLGGALIQDRGLMQYGLNIVAGFDTDPKVVGKTINGVPIFHIDDIKQQQTLYNASIAVLAVPVECAQQVTDRVIDAGLHAIWNFTPYRIKPNNMIVVQNTSIYAHLALMYNRMNECDFDNK
ncbi:MAG: redox-sensing transcriptional repressor Rex [Muribaculaceae bacterium]